MAGGALLSPRKLGIGRYGTSAGRWLAGAPGCRGDREWRLRHRPCSLTGWASDQSTGAARTSVSRVSVCRPGSRDLNVPEAGRSRRRRSLGPTSVPAQQTNLDSAEVEVSGDMCFGSPEERQQDGRKEGGQHSGPSGGFRPPGAWTNEMKGS